MLKRIWRKIKDALTFPWRVRAMLIELHDIEEEEKNGNE